MAKNILFIIERMGPGGTEKQLHSLINGLKLSGKINPYLCTLRPSISLLDTIRCPLIELNIEKIFALRTIKILRTLRAFCNENKIDVIQTYFQDPAILGAMLKLKMPLKLIGAFRDLGFWKTPVENFKMRLAYRQFDGFIANSNAVKAHYAKEDKIEDKKIKVIYNGLSAERIISPEQVGQYLQNDPIVGIVGNCNRTVKRMEDFVEAAAQIKRTMPDTRFMIIGGGDQKTRLEKRCKELNIEDSVEFTGMIDDPFETIKKLSVGVNTSASEGFSNAVIEIMACGIPVVVTDVGGNRELVENGRNGFRVPVGDCTAIAEKIMEILKKPDSRYAFGIENITKIKKMYSMERMISEHEEYYSGLTNE